MSKGNKRIFKKFYIALFLAMIFLPWIVWGGVRIFAPEYYAEQTDLSKEKRNKNELHFIDLLDSGESLSAYVDDRVPFRRGMLDIYQDYEGKTEKVYQDTMRKVLSLFTGKGTEQKQVGNLDDMLGGGGSSSNDASGNQPTQEVTEGLNHIHSLEVAEIVEPDCENTGYILYKCENCTYTQKDITPPRGHDYVLIRESAVSYETYGYKQYQCKVCGKLEIRDFEAKYVDTTYMAPQIISGITMLGRFNWLFYAEGSYINYYTGKNVLAEEDLANYAAKVNRLKELCDARGITPIIMFMPNKDQVYSEYMPTMEVVTEYKRTQQLTDYINANTSVPCLYPLEELKAASVFWPVYYKYDTHWNYMGAFVGLQALYKVLGIETTNPSLIPAPESYETRNDLIALAGLSQENYPADVEYVPYYRSEIYVEGYDQYAAISHTYSNSANQCKLVMLADSYRELMYPYITKDFSECVIAHRDYTDNLAEDIKTCNTLLITAVERHDKRVFSCIDKVIAILEQP